MRVSTVSRRHSILPGNYPPLPQGGVNPLKLFDAPGTVPTGGVKSSYTYSDRVYAIISYMQEAIAVA